MSIIQGQLSSKLAAQAFQLATQRYCQAVSEAILSITPEDFSVDLHVTIRIGSGGKPVIKVRPQPLFKGGAEGTT